MTTFPDVAARTASIFAVCTLTLAAGSGCRGAQPAAAGESAIDFVVWPSANAASRTPSGSFDVRGIDNAEHARVGIGSNSARTLHVRLPAGSYAVAWAPADAALEARRSDAAVEQERQEWPQIIVVEGNAPTTIEVHLAPSGSGIEPRVELASVAPI